MRLLTILLFATAGWAGNAWSKDAPPVSYHEAIELVHAFSGAGDELRRARQIAQQLAGSHPAGGYAEVIQAEMLSTWNLDMDGNPPQLLAHILALTDQALRVNPDLALAHVARARALIRAGRHDEAGKSLEQALALEPDLLGAFFLLGEMGRRTGRLEQAELWFTKFIGQSSRPARKSNGYYWLALAYQAAANERPREWDAYIAKARHSYEQMIALDQGFWKHINFAVFLNNEGADFPAAEAQAKKALAIAEAPMARYHLAIAQYQKLLAMQASEQGLRLLASQVAKTTGVPLEQAIAFAAQQCNCHSMHARLEKLRTRIGTGAAA